MTSDRLKPRRTHHASYALAALAAALRRGAVTLGDVDTLVDFGCGDQPYRALFTERARRYVGVDIASNPSADVHLSEQGGIPLPDASADVVLSTQVLEHVPDPSSYLSEAHRVLRPGGSLLLSTHGVWPYHPHPEDYWRWTASGLRRVLENAGYDVVGVEGILGSAGAGIQLWQDALLTRIPPWLHAPFVLAAQSAIALHERVSTAENRARDAAIYVVHARRRAAA